MEQQRNITAGNGAEDIFCRRVLIALYENIWSTLYRTYDRESTFTGEVTSGDTWCLYLALPDGTCLASFCPDVDFPLAYKADEPWLQRRLPTRDDLERAWDEIHYGGLHFPCDEQDLSPALVGDWPTFMEFLRQQGIDNPQELHQCLLIYNRQPEINAL